MARILVLDTLKHPSNSGTANIVLSSDETTTMPTVNINGGQIDSTTIGASNASTVAATTLSTTSNTTIGGTLGVTGNTTLSASANNIGTVTAGTLGSAVVYPDGHLIKTHIYQRGTGISAYEVTSQTLTCMTDTVAVSAVSGRTYFLEFQGNLGLRTTNSTAHDMYAYWGIYEPGSDFAPGDTTVGGSGTGLNLSTTRVLGQCRAASALSLFEYGTEILSYAWVAGSTATQYFCLAGQPQSTNTALMLSHLSVLIPGNTYKFILREYQGSCLTTNF